jgi:acetyl-CoA carboxylase carboxyl transferase subunit alpha
MARLKTPIICAVIGEGGSGGALAIGVGDRLLMLQYSTYSVISPEGCASILWKSAEYASQAADAMGITSDRLKELELIDQIIPEPLGGAHRDYDAIAKSLKSALLENLEYFQAMPIDKLLEQRYERLMQYGNFSEG